MQVSTETIRTLGPQEVLLGIVEDARSIPIAEYENEPAETLRRELVPEVRALAQKTVRVLDPLVDPEYVAADEDGRADADGRYVASARAFARRVDDLIRSSDAVDHLGDLAFMARGELRSKLRLLGNTEELDSWELIERSGSAIRKVVKTATALDLVLGDCTGIHHLSFETELETSLQVRRAYGKFRRHVLDFEAADLGVPRLEQQLNNAATAIARLIGRDIYLGLRVSDRVELRRLQGRIIDWITRSRHDVRAGQRLLQDIRSFVELLAQINHRQEFREHDRRLIPHLVETLAAPSADERVPASLRGELERLVGLDQELDRLLFGTPPARVGQLRSMLERVEESHRAAAW